MSTTTAETNKSLLSKRVDAFYTSFYGFPENVSNVMGSRVKSLERPNPTFTYFTVPHKGIKQTGSTTIEFTESTIEFEDDESGLVMRALYQQLYSQRGTQFNANRFEIGVKVMSAKEKVVEEFIMKRCYIVNISHSQGIYSDSTGNVITVTLKYDDVEYKGFCD